MFLTEGYEIINYLQAWQLMGEELENLRCRDSWSLTAVLCPFETTPILLTSWPSDQTKPLVQATGALAVNVAVTQDLYYAINQFNTSLINGCFYASTQSNEIGRCTLTLRIQNGPDAVANHASSYFADCVLGAVGVVGRAEEFFAPFLEGSTPIWAADNPPQALLDAAYVMRE